MGRSVRRTPLPLPDTCPREQDLEAVHQFFPLGFSSDALSRPRSQKCSSGHFIKFYSFPFLLFISLILWAPLFNMVSGGDWRFSIVHKVIKWDSFPNSVYEKNQSFGLCAASLTFSGIYGLVSKLCILLFLCWHQHNTEFIPMALEYTLVPSSMSQLYSHFPQRCVSWLSYLGPFFPYNYSIICLQWNSKYPKESWTGIALIQY